MDAIVSRDNNPYISFQTGSVPIPNDSFVDDTVFWC